MSKNIVETEVKSFREDIEFDVTIEARPGGTFLVLRIDDRQWAKGPLDDDDEDYEDHCIECYDRLRMFFKEM
jgi:hypothetical protein